MGIRSHTAPGLRSCVSSLLPQSSKKQLVPPPCLPPAQGRAPAISAGNCPGIEITQGVFPSRWPGKKPDSTGGRKEAISGEVSLRPCPQAWLQGSRNFGPDQPPSWTPTQKGLLLWVGGFSGSWSLGRALLRSGQFIWAWPGAQRVVSWRADASVLWGVRSYVLCPKAPPWGLQLDILWTEPGPPVPDPTVKEMAVQAPEPGWIHSFAHSFIQQMLAEHLSLVLVPPERER